MQKKLGINVFGRAALDHVDRVHDLHRYAGEVADFSDDILAPSS